MSETFAAFQDINASVQVSPSAELLTNRGVVHQVSEAGRCTGGAIKDSILRFVLVKLVIRIKVASFENKAVKSAIQDRNCSLKSRAVPLSSSCTMLHLSIGSDNINTVYCYYKR